MGQVDMESGSIANTMTALLQDEDDHQNLKKSDDDEGKTQALYPKRPGFTGYLRT